MRISFCITALALAAPVVSAQIIVVHPCETLVLDPNASPIVIDQLIVEPGGTLRVAWGSQLRIHALSGIHIEGLADFSGEHAHEIVLRYNGTIQEVGGLGGPMAGMGGLGNPVPGTANPKGGDALNFFGHPSHRNARGGESAYNGSNNPTPRRAGGGGGGAFAANQPVVPNPFDPANLGLIALDGFDGPAQAFGALTHQSPPRRGAAGVSIFIDNDPTNDFWGRAIDPISHNLIIGELPFPNGGRGGGAGGDSYMTSSFPPTPYLSGSMNKGAGGGGGGGLAILVTPRFEISGDGVVRCNGGNGAAGENTNGFDHIGGGSGGGSGGMLIVQAGLIDLHAANPRCLTALGGRGGPGANDVHHTTGAGGDGGPGIIQFHTTNGLADIRLPSNKTLADMTAPTAHVLLPESGL
jgi:hypothetical protein